jgi:ankyrin repeat protein
MNLRSRRELHEQRLRRFAAVTVIAVVLGGVWMTSSGQSGLRYGNLAADQVFINPNLLTLVRAVELEDQKAIKRAVQQGADVRAMGSDGVSVLHWALLKTDIKVETVRLLLELGADPNATREAQRTPIQILAGGNRLDLLELLLSMGGDANRPPPGTGWVPLGHAIAAQREDNIRVLLRHGADPNQGSVCLQTVANARYDFLALLLENGLTKDLSVCKSYILQRSISGQDPDRVKWRETVIKLLEKKGA